MPKIAAIGEEDLVLGFLGVGVEVHPAKNAEEAAARLRELAPGRQYALILITESVAEGCLDIVASIRERGEAMVLVIPSHQGSAGLALKEMKRQVIRSVGVDLLSKG